MPLGLILLALWTVAPFVFYFSALPPDLSALYVASYFWAENQQGMVYAGPENSFGTDFPRSLDTALVQPGA